MSSSRACHHDDSYYLPFFLIKSLFLAVLGHRCCLSISLVAASEVCSLIALRRLLISVTSVVPAAGGAGFSSWGSRAQELLLLGSRGSTGLVAPQHVESSGTRD